MFYMPQLNPLFFVNQIVFAFVFLCISFICINNTNKYHEWEGLAMLNKLSIMYQKICSASD